MTNIIVIYWTAVKGTKFGDIEAEASPKINPKIHDLNFVMLA